MHAFDVHQLPKIGFSLHLQALTKAISVHYLFSHCINCLVKKLQAVLIAFFFKLCFHRLCNIFQGFSSLKLQKEKYSVSSCCKEKVKFETCYILLLKQKTGHRKQIVVA